MAHEQHVDDFRDAEDSACFVLYDSDGIDPDTVISAATLRSHAGARFKVRRISSL